MNTLTKEQIEYWRNRMQQGRIRESLHSQEIDALCDLALCSLEAPPSTIEPLSPVALTKDVIQKWKAVGAADPKLRTGIYEDEWERLCDLAIAGLSARSAPGEEISVSFDRETWGAIIDGLVLECDRSESRHAANPQSLSRERMKDCNAAIAKINGAMRLPRMNKEKK